MNFGQKTKLVDRDLKFEEILASERGKEMMGHKRSKKMTILVRKYFS